MAFPVVETTVVDADVGDPQTLSLPAGIVAGDKILVGIAHTTTADTPATPAGYDLLAASGMSTDGYVLWGKTAVGGETTVSVNFAATQSTAMFGYRISNWGVIEVSAPSQGGSGTQPDLPSFTPAGGAADILWLACVFCSASNHVGGSNSLTDYTDKVELQTNQGITIRSCRRLINTTNQDPGVWACAADTHGWDALLVAIYPALAVPAAPANPAAVAASASQIDVSWDDVADETGFRVERSPDGSGSWVDVSGNLAAGTLTYSDTGLACATQYFYRVIAFNASGDSPASTTVSDTTFACVSPTGQKVVRSPRWGTTRRIST